MNRRGLTIGGEPTTGRERVGDDVGPDRTGARL